MHRRERRHCWRDYVLRAQFSARPARVPDAMGICLVPMDPLAGVVGLRLVDFVSAYRCFGTEGRHQFRLIGCAFGQRGCGHCRLVTLEKREAQ